SFVAPRMRLAPLRSSVDDRTGPVPHGPVLVEIDVQPDEEGPAHQVPLRDEAPVTAVPAVVTVVAHHEIAALRHRPFTLAAPAVRHTQDVMLVGAELLAVQLR